MKLKYIFFLSAALSLTGCNDGFLDRGPQDLNDKTFWNTVKDLETYANAFYGILPDGVTNLGDENSDNQIPFKPNSFLWGQYTVPAEDGEWSKNNWRNIRNINYFMTHYQSATGSEKEINQYVAEVRFFRALEYFNKIKTFGDVPWLDKDLDVDSGELFGKKMPRNQVAQKIIEDLKFAIENLPEKGKEAPNRLNADIAKHLLGRVCLNEGTYYKYHTELGYAGEADALLKMAASITDELITKGNYEIYSTGKPEEDYYNLFIMEDKSKLKEAVLYIDFEPNLRYHNATRWLRNAKSGWSKDFADCFLYTDGKPASATSKAHEQNKSMAEEAKDRDPRFKQLILTEAHPYTVTADGKNTYLNEKTYVSKDCPTGYWVRKYFNPDPSQDIESKSTFDGIAYRYAETLLINAEAKAELGTIKQEDLNNTVNKLRDRVGMPHLTLQVGFEDAKWPQWGYNLSPLLQEIRRERRIELAGEGFRFDDLKRWKAGKLVNNVQTYIGKYVQGSDGSWKPTIVYGNYTNDDLSYQEGKSRTWNDKMYLYPIPSGEPQRNPGLLPQNPGWE